MSFFTNPFSSQSGSQNTINMPTTTINPTSTSLRRTSLVRSSPGCPSSTGTSSSSSSSQAAADSAASPHLLQAGSRESPVTFVSPFGSVKSNGGSSGSSSPVPKERKASLAPSSAPSSRPPSRGNGSPNDPARQSSTERNVSSRRSSLQTTSTNSTRRSPPPPILVGLPFFTAGLSPKGPVSPGLAGPTSAIIQEARIDFTRRRSVDVGVLGMGARRVSGYGSASKRIRDAVGPDSGDKEHGLLGAGPKGTKDRLSVGPFFRMHRTADMRTRLGRNLASILAHSLSLCASEPAAAISAHAVNDETGPSTSQPLGTIPGSPANSQPTSRNTSITASTFSSRGSIDASLQTSDPSVPTSPSVSGGPSTPFPPLEDARRFKLIGNLQSWSFNAMSYSDVEQLYCVTIMFEGLLTMEGVDFDLGALLALCTLYSPNSLFANLPSLERLRLLLLSLQHAYHSRNGYHNFAHALDVSQACYSFLVKMGLAPPLYLLCSDEYLYELGDERKRWRRSRAVEQSGMAELLRPMDVFALMVAAIGHDVGHPGLSNAYMANAKTPLAQIYETSTLENFHTVTLIQMLRKHGFGYLLGGDFQGGRQATDFRKVVEASILATDMSRHFPFVNEINEMGRRFGDRKSMHHRTIEADRLLLCSGLMKCADISNPARPHHISRAWSTALLQEWAVQASLETEYGLPVTVVTIDPTDTRAQAKTQIGFIDLFARPLFNAMAAVVDEFERYAELLRDGRTAWEVIMSTGDASPPTSSTSSEGKKASRSRPVSTEFSATPKLVPPKSQPASPQLEYRSETIERTRSGNSPVQAHHPPTARRIGMPRRPKVLTRQMSETSSSPTGSPRSFGLFSPSSTTSPFSAFGMTSPGLYSSSGGGSISGGVGGELRSACGGVCKGVSATCAACLAREREEAQQQEVVSNFARRASLGFALSPKGRHKDPQLGAGVVDDDFSDDEDEADVEDDDDEAYFDFEVDRNQQLDVWPPYPFRCTKEYT